MQKWSWIRSSPRGNVCTEHSGLLAGLGGPWTLKHCGPEGKLTISVFILPNANALLAFRIFSWKLVFMHNSPFNVNGKLLNLSSTNLPWEQQKSYVLLLTYTHLQIVNFYTHCIPSLYLLMDTFLRFRYWQLKVSFLVVRYVTFFIVSFFNIAFLFSTSFWWSIRWKIIYR